MNQKVFKQVRRFVSDLTLKPIEQIKPETNLYFDIGLTFESAPIFFERFALAFEVDLAGMDLGPYFHESGEYDGSGGDGGTMIWLFWLFTNERHQFRGIKPLLVSDLVAMAASKRWCVAQS